MFNRCGEYTSNELTQFCQQHRIVHQVTPPYSPQSNGVANTRTGSLWTWWMSCSLISVLPRACGGGGEALITACNIPNKIPFKHSDKTPYELWKRAPKLEFLRMWRCLVKVGIPESNNRKIWHKIINVIMIGFAS